uniref:Putative dnaJ protein n=1 Tax=Cupiennius salei TaxID=6928 RepID=T1E179_CUPSA
MPVQVPKSPSLTKRKVNQDVNSNDAKEGEKPPVYTEEQKQAVDRVRKCNDYYEILGVSKDVSEADLRKQYKKLALQFHPDKNKAPGSVEAFKAIGNAFAVLSDPVKRKKYDTYGLDAVNATENHPFRQGYAAYGSSFEGDISPEELYNMFFQGHHTFVRRGSQWQRYYTRTAHAHVYQEEHSRSTLMQILPLVIIVMVSMFSSFFVADPPYSLHKTMKYSHEQRTSNLDIPYYVKENFLNEYKGRISHIEKNVEEDYIVTVRTSCFRERNYKENMIFRAKHFKDITLETKARELRTPSCDMLNDLYNSLN